MQIYEYVENIFHQRYYNSGGLFSTNLTTGPAPTLINPQTFAPGKPFAI